MIGLHSERIQKCGEKVNILNKVDHTIGIILCRCVDLLLGALDNGIDAPHTVFCAASLLREKAHAMKIDDRREEPTRYLVYEIAEMMASLIEKLNNKPVEDDDEIEFLEVITKETNEINNNDNDNNNINNNMAAIHEDATKENNGNKNKNGINKNTAMQEDVTTEDNEKKNNNYNNNNSNNPTLHEGAIIEDVPDFKMEEIVEDDTFDPDLCLKMEDSTPYYEEEVEVESTHYASPSTFKDHLFSAQETSSPSVDNLSETTPTSFKDPIHSSQNNPILSNILAANLTPTAAKVHSNAIQPSHSNKVSDTFITSTNAKVVYQLPFANAIERALNPQFSDKSTYATPSQKDLKENNANTNSSSNLAKEHDNFTIATPTASLINRHSLSHHSNKVIAEMLSMMHNPKPTIINNNSKDNNNNNNNNTQQQQFQESNELMEEDHEETVEFVQQSTLNDDADIGTPSSIGPQTGFIRKNKCTICGRCFGAASHLKDHMTTHTGDRPVRCTLCYGNFINTSKLKRHMRDRHRMGEFKCSTCDRVFKRKMDLMNHKDTTGSCVKDPIRQMLVPEPNQHLPVAPNQRFEPNIQLSDSIRSPRTFNPW